VSEQEEDFATMFEASVKALRFKQGQTVEGTIVAFGQDVAFVSIGGKSEAQIDLAELKDDEGDVEFSVGDRVQAVVVSTSGGITLSRKGVRNAATRRELENAFHAGLAVEGKVETTTKGGYDVRIAGQRAFCPLSQIDTSRTADPEAHVGKTYTFKIIEFKDDGRSIVVSRRKLLEEEQQASAAAVRSSIVPDAVLTGRVVSVPDFGAFIDLGGGIQGLLHVSDMSWSRATTPGSIVAAGDQLTVKVLRVDEGTGKISLGLKQLEDDPWSTVAATYEAGQVTTGRVTRLADFGAFVELAPGIEALAHASTFPPTGRQGGWKKSVSVGATVAVEVLSVDPAQKRIGIALLEEGSARGADISGEASAGVPAGASADASVGAPADTSAGARAGTRTGSATGGSARASASRDALAPGTIVIGKVERHERFGVFVFLSPGRTALMPFSESGLDRDADLVKAFPAGSDIEVVVLEADAAGRRIRVSRKAVAQQREQAELRDYAARKDATPSSSMGSLADKLRDALNKGSRR
jgi:small subunit ribosomal protein S1